MGSVKLTKLIPAVVLAAGIFSPNIASAADLLMDPPVIEAPEAVPTGGWYLRGDITYDFRESEGGTIYNPMANMYHSTDMEDSWDLGFGVGYQVNDYFRVDVTGDYVFGSAWTGHSHKDEYVCEGLTTSGGGSVTWGNEPGTCDTTSTADVAMLKLLANAYVDLGTYSGFTPYVGAGIGGAYVMYDDLVQDKVGTGACCVALSGTTTHKGIDSWRFAYALHAGVSVDLSHKWKLDLGYSYSDVAGGAQAEFADGPKPQSYDDGFTDHVLRAGLRYQIW